MHCGYLILYVTSNMIKLYIKSYKPTLELTPRKMNTFKYFHIMKLHISH